MLHGEILLFYFWLHGFCFLVVSVLWPIYMYFIPSEGISAYY